MQSALRATTRAPRRAARTARRREPVDDLTVEGVPWCSDDMVSFERTIRLGQFAVISNDVCKLTGRAPRSLREFAVEHAAFLKSV